MHRDRVTLGVDNTRWHTDNGTPAQPVCNLNYDGSPEHLQTYLRDRARAEIEPAEIDVSFRIISPDTSPQVGMFALSDRVTGDYILECETTVEPLRRLINAAQAYGEQVENDSRYELHLRADQTVLACLNMNLLLVYGPSGTLRRETSLVPQEVEV